MMDPAATTAGRAQRRSFGEDNVISRVNTIDSPMITPFRPRTGRLFSRKGDPMADVSYGDAISDEKAKGVTRFMFQNVKGLTHTTGGADYDYYLDWMASYAVDMFGLAETNSSWEQRHVDFKGRVNRQFRYAKSAFGYPTDEVDPCHQKTTFQAGGNVQVAQGRLATATAGPTIQDPSGLGRWCGFTLEGKKAQHLSVITAYRVCDTAISTSTLGSAFHREYHYYQEKGETRPQPRKRFLEDLKEQIKQLQSQDHAVLLMLDANATLDSDTNFRDN